MEDGFPELYLNHDSNNVTSTLPAAAELSHIISLYHSQVNHHCVAYHLKFVVIEFDDLVSFSLVIEAKLCQTATLESQPNISYVW